MRSWQRIIKYVRLAYSPVQQSLYLFRPRRYTEKMQWRKLFDLDPMYLVFCDKVAVREYVAERVGADAVVPILWLGGDPDALPFAALKPPYIIKCSHGSGWNIVIRASNWITTLCALSLNSGWRPTVGSLDRTRIQRCGSPTVG